MEGRFPPDLVFQLIATEVEDLKPITNCDRFRRHRNPRFRVRLAGAPERSTKSHEIANYEIDVC